MTKIPTTRSAHREVDLLGRPPEHRPDPDRPLPPRAALHQGALGVALMALAALLSAGNVPALDEPVPVIPQQEVRP